MMKIKTRRDVKDLIDFMVNEPVQLQIYDDEWSNQLISIEDDGAMGYYVNWEDTVNGISGKDFMYPCELSDKIWRNREFINKTKQLGRIYDKIMKE